MVRVEASGGSVGEAKWNALRELERLDPSLDRDTVVFDVLTEGERGLLGVGYEPARVAASATGVATAGDGRRLEEGEDERRLRELLERVSSALGIRCRVEISESADALTATLAGDDLGLLIGRHGQTLDAVQLLATAILRRGEEGREVVVDAAGYRARRREQVEQLAAYAAEEAQRSGSPVPLEPMTAADRKLVHGYLEQLPGVTSSSEGADPHRYVVVEPT
jgi:spoIIIJ-associated protein